MQHILNTARRGKIAPQLCDVFNKTGQSAEEIKKQLEQLQQTLKQQDLLGKRSVDTLSEIRQLKNITPSVEMQQKGDSNCVMIESSNFEKDKHNQKMIEKSKKQTYVNNAFDTINDDTISG